MPKEPRFDVVIYRVETRTVAAITGRNLRRDKGHYNAEKRADTVSARVNTDYDVEIVPAGKFKVGDTLPEDV